MINRTFSKSIINKSLINDLKEKYYYLNCHCRSRTYPSFQISLIETYKGENVTSFTRIFHLSCLVAENFFLLQIVKILKKKKKKKLNQNNENEISNYDLALYTVRNIFPSFRKIPRKDTGFIFSSRKIFLDSSHLLKVFYYITFLHEEY